MGNSITGRREEERRESKKKRKIHKFTAAHFVFPIHISVTLFSSSGKFTRLSKHNFSVLCVIILQNTGKKREIKMGKRNKG